MSTTTTTTTPPAFAATIGLDWADHKHDLWLRPAAGGKAEHLRLEQTPEALHTWVAKLRQRFDNRPIALGLETSRGPVISALLAYDFITLFPINPKALKDYRAAFSVSGAKDDRTDAQLLEEFIRLHRDKLRPLIGKHYNGDTDRRSKNCCYNSLPGAIFFGHDCTNGARYCDHEYARQHLN